MTVAWNSDVDLTLEMGFGDDPKATSVAWTDVSAYIQKLVTVRGRSNERDTVQAGTLDVVLDNFDRRFDPTNTTGPYYATPAPGPNVIPAVPVRLRAVHNVITYDLFRGTIDAWPLVYPDKSGALAEVPIHASDDFKLIGLDEITGTEVLEKSGVRIGNLLDKMTWPAGRRDIAVGIMDVVASDFRCQKPLQEIKKIVDSELGLFFMAGNGDANFQNQTYRAGLSVVKTFSDSPAAGELPYDDLVFTYDDTQIWNDITGTRAGSTAARFADDATSVAQYGRRRLTLNDLLLTNDTHLQTMVDLYLARYKDPGIRAQTLVFKPQLDPVNQWPQALGAELSDKYKVERDPPGGGTPAVISQDVHVENIRHSVTPDEWVTTWQLSPA